jgi:hypothetical protein
LASISIEPCSPRVYKGGQGPPPNQSTFKAIQTTTQDVEYYAYCCPNLSKVSCFLHLQVSDLGDTLPIIYHLGGISRWAWRLNTDSWHARNGCSLSIHQRTRLHLSTSLALCSPRAQPSSSAPRSVSSTARVASTTIWPTLGS